MVVSHRRYTWQHCLAGCCFIICFPLIYYLNRKDAKNEKRREIRFRRSKTAPDPSRDPNTRRRWALSNSDLSIEQVQTNLLFKLPRELRTLIWEHSIGEPTFHIHQYDHDAEFRSTTCHASLKTGNSQRHLCIEGYSAQMSRAASPRNILALPLTCRQMYFETIDMLYVKSTFTTVDIYFLQFLPNLLLPQRINNIKSFIFEWNVSYRGASINGVDRLFNLPEQWDSVWKSLASMKGLKYLSVTFRGSQREWEANIVTQLPASNATSYMAPVMKITAPEVFELNFPFVCDATESPWKDLPCTIGVTSAELWPWQRHGRLE